MKNISFETQGTNAYLVYELESDENIDTYAKGMLQENEVEGIISPSFVQKDEKRQLKYKVASLISLKDFLMHPMEKESLITIIRSVMNASASLSEYMLSEDSLLLDPEYVYFSLNTKELYMIYLPVDPYANGTTLREFILRMISHCTYDTEKRTDYVALVINAMNDPACGKNPSVLMSELERISKKTDEALPVKKEAAERKPAPVHEAVEAAASVPVPAVKKPEPTEKISEKKPLFSIFGKKETEKTPKEAPKEKKASPVRPPAGIRGFAVPGAESAPPVPASVVPSAPVKPAAAKEGKKLFGFGKKAESVPKKSEKPEKTAKSGLSISGFSIKKPVPVPQAVTPATVEERRESGVLSYAGESNGSEHTVVFGGEEEGGTVIIGSEAVGTAAASGIKMAKVTCKRTGKSMIIDKDVFHIGRDSGFVDFLIADNRAISAAHADIVRENGTYFLVDKNSSNHTYLNGTMLEPQKKYPLGDMDSVVVANEEIEFTLD